MSSLKLRLVDSPPAHAQTIPLTPQEGAFLASVVHFARGVNGIFASFGASRRLPSGRLWLAAPRPLWLAWRPHRALIGGSPCSSLAVCLRRRPCSLRLPQRCAHPSRQRGGN